MLNIPDLEKRWLRYKLKSYLPSVFVALSLIVGVIIYTFVTLTPTKTTQPLAQIELVQQKVSHKQIEKKTAVVPSLNKKEVNITTLSPSMQFINQLKTASYQTQSKPIVKTKKVIHKKLAPKVLKKAKKIEQIDKIDKFPITTITITKQDTDKDIQNILKRFQEDKNPALSLFLAKKYYELGKYEEASKYALITNQLNKEIDDSWLIFSKALVKMHHKDKAINILQKYIQSSHSTNAAMLLHDIQSGEFR